MFSPGILPAFFYTSSVLRFATFSYHAGFIAFPCQTLFDCRQPVVNRDIVGTGR